MGDLSGQPTGLVVGVLADDGTGHGGGPVPLLEAVDPGDQPPRSTAARRLRPPSVGDAGRGVHPPTRPVPAVTAELGHAAPADRPRPSGHRPPACPAAGRRVRPVAHQPSARRGSLVTLPLAVWGRPPVTRTKDGAHLVPRSGWDVEEGGKPVGVERTTGEQLERGHHLVARARVGHRVDGHGGHPVVADQDPLDGSGGQVLRVHPHPVARAARRSRRTRPRRGRPGPRSSTSRPGSGTRWPPRRRSTPRTRRCRRG